jgi:glucose/arabinose dehydrogenase
MKHLLWILVLGCALPAAAPAQAARKDKAAPKAKAAQAVVLPAGAEKLEEGVWRAKDERGRMWIYKQTPFGLIRMEEEQARAEAKAAEPELRVVEVRGGMAVFERVTPFGRKSWTRPLDKLDQDESRALDAWKRAQR